MESTTHRDVFEAEAKMLKSLSLKNPHKPIDELRKHAKDIVRAECLADTIQILNLVRGGR